MLTTLLDRLKRALRAEPAVSRHVEGSGRNIEWEVETSRGHKVLLRRAYDESRIGLSAAWPSRLGARELVRLCTHDELAVLNTMTDIVVFVPGEGPHPYTGTLEQFVSDRDVDDAIVRFNTPNWSMVIWPKQYTPTGEQMVQYTGEQPDKGFLLPLLENSLIDNRATVAKAVADEIHEFDHSTV